MSPPLRSPAGTAVLTAPPPTVRRARVPPGSPPPDDGDGGDGGGGGGNPGDFARPGDPDGVGPLALALTMVGITTLFVVVMAVWWFLRRDAANGGTAPESGVPALVWISTALLLASSAGLERAARRQRRVAERPDAVLLRWLGLSLLLGTAFLLAQVRLWLGLWRDGFVPASSGLAAGFFALTGLHALHALGGLGFLGTLTLRLRRAQGRAPSVRLGALFWHFLGLLWLALLTVLFGLA